MKNILNKILISLLLFSSVQGYCSSIIVRDSEVENAISEVIMPLIRVSGLRTLKIHILSDNKINAFTAGGEEIFINSGLITIFPDAEVLRGVVAHEMGHILGHHVLRKIEDFESNEKFASGSIALGLVSAIAGNPAIGMAILGGGVNTAYSANLGSSRVYEASADQSALQLLEKSGNSALGLLKLLNFLNANDTSDHLFPYDTTHPLSQERISAVSLFVRNSKYKSPTTSAKISYNFRRAAYKLAAFTTSLSDNIPKSGNNEIDKYVETIISFRKGQIDKAISLIDSLIALRPNDPYYHELKGQMLFEFGRKECYVSYQKASSLLPNDDMIRLSKAIVMLNVINDHKIYPEIIDDLKSSYQKDQNNLVPLYFLSVAYGKSGDDARSSLYNAIRLFKQGKIKDAKAMAKFAASKLTPNSPEWYKANDIILSQ